MKPAQPVSVAVFGSSLFLRAISTLLENDEWRQPVFFSESTALATILHHDPTVLLYQTDTPPADLPLLLAAELVVVEITPDKNQMTVYQPHAPSQNIAIANALGFQTKLISLIVTSAATDPEISAANLPGAVDV